MAEQLSSKLDVFNKAWTFSASGHMYPIRQNQLFVEQIWHKAISTHTVQSYLMTPL